MVNVSHFELHSSNFSCEAPRVLEHLQPWAGFAGELVAWSVAHLHRAEQAFGVRHHDGGAAVGCGEAGDATRGAVRVRWIAFGWLSFAVHIAQA
mgnify:CR=1 FL=1